MLFIIVLVITIILAILSYIFDQNDHNFISACCGIPAIVTGFTSVIMIIALLITYINCAQIETKWQERYISLNTRIENHMYSIEDRGDLIKEVQEWNEDFVAQERAHNDFWVGIFNPESIEGLSKIDLTKIK